MPRSMLSPTLTRERYSAAAAALLCFVALYCALIVFAPPDAAQRQAADPLVQLLVPFGGFIVIPFIAATIALFWLWRWPPGTTEFGRGFVFAGVGAAAGLAATLLIRIVHGETLPSFIPSEESSAPGMALGVGAGVIEEALFRLGILPLLFLALRRHFGPWAAAGGACFLTGLAFALSHELGPGASAVFDPVHFATRVLIPGVAMSAVALFIHPAFIIAAHCSAHILIAVFFVAAGGGS